jgi:glycosyltransferase involved in cell wall biosynthesis
MKILFLPRYDESGASSRYRIYQYLPFFSQQGINLTVSPLLDNQYVKNLNDNSKNSIFSLIFHYLKRVFSLLKSGKYDIIFIEKEIFPFLPDLLFIFNFFRIKYIVDFDDAIFHNYDDSFSINKVAYLFNKNKIPHIISDATYIICGSPYLTKYALQYNGQVIEIPTSIDLTKYELRRLQNNIPDFTIGWIGSNSTSKHFLIIKDALLKFCSKFSCKVNLIGFDQTLSQEFDRVIPITFIPWQESTEIEELCKFTVGVMPLPDEPFERGKCGFKLIQYMACGIPTISTPLEANLKIDRGNGNLFAETQEDWYNNFVKIYQQREKYKIIGIKNIATVKEHYSIQANADKYISIFNQIMS